VNDPKLKVDEANEKVEAVVSTVAIGIGELLPLKVNPKSVALELIGPPLKLPKEFQSNVTVSARATP